MQTIDINRVIDRDKLSPLQWLVFFLGFLVFFCDGLDTGIIGFVAPSLLDDWGITKPQLAPVLSAALVGMSIGAIVSGPLADKFGRKKVIVTTTLIFAIFTVLCGFATSTQDLTIYRFITGIGLGAAMPNISTIVSEYMPSKRKAFLTGLAGCGFMLGISCGGVLSAFLLENLGWAKVIIIGGVIPVLLAVILMLKLPESTQYLVKKNQHQQARYILEKIQGQAFSENVQFKLATTENNLSNESPVKQVLGKYLWGSSMLWLCCFMSLLVFYLLTSWMPTILKTAGFTTQQFSLIAAIFPFGGVIGATVMGYYMDRTNPTNVIKYSYFIAFLLFILTGFISSNILLFGMSIFMIGALLAGAQSSLLPLSAMFYPSTCRAVGVSWMHGIGRVGAILGAFFGSLIFTFELSLSGIFYVLAIPTLISFIALSLKVMVEKSKSKQQIKSQELA
ncbi:MULTISPECIES: aromatic acid/H+ symport family MFS transporter [Acinetobacter]|uniref:MFS transporter n=1 Tax=Acinetobacter TaxID=469 RepID=UPI0010222E64|nr:MULTISPECIES: aromatic acid/H+ symport family MFS transporter [Acinetobacter]MDM1758231.1 aromatic acid/H+ symport family MFS transporter [Acinetobacter sp. 256-1]MDM1760604.1 aromatic acid/H+ symport family MFS transporter [Acinetobacter sp. 251-1]RYL26587.1 MFS transporter [Acinetobacter piscicola]